MVMSPIGGYHFEASHLALLPSPSWVFLARNDIIGQKSGTGEDIYGHIASPE